MGVEWRVPSVVASCEPLPFVGAGLRPRRRLQSPLYPQAEACAY